jgi:hypothetical protein
VTEGHLDSARQALVQAQALLYATKVDAAMQDVAKAAQLIRYAGNQYKSLLDGLSMIYGKLGEVKPLLDQAQRYTQLAEANLNQLGQGPG